MSVGYDFEPEWFACGQSPLVRRGRPPGALGRGGRGRRRQHRLRLEPVGVPRRGRRPAGPDDQRSGQRRAARSRSARPIATCRTSTASPTSHPRARPATAGSSRTSWRPARRSSPARSAARRAEAAAASARRRPQRDRRPSTRRTAARAWRRRTSPASSPRSCRSGASSSGSPSGSRRSSCRPRPTCSRERYFQGNGLVDLMRAIQSV